MVELHWLRLEQGGLPGVETTSPSLAPFNNSGRSCLWFDGQPFPATKAFMSKDTKFNLNGDDHTVLAVVGRQLATPNNWFFGLGEPVSGAWCGGDDDSDNPQPCPNTHMFMGFWNDVNGFRHEQWFNAVDVAMPAPTPFATNPALVVAMLDRAGGTGRSLSVNGNRVASTNTQPLQLSIAWPMAIGTNIAAQRYWTEDGGVWAFAGPRFQGYFCEMIIYERALSPTELSTEVEYLSRKYNLDTTTP